MSLKTTTARANSALDLLLDGVNNEVDTAGYLNLYSGTPPANLAAGITGTLLARCDLVDGAEPAFAAASSLEAVGYVDGNFAVETSIIDDGVCTHFRLFTHDDIAICQGLVAESGGDLNLTSTTISTGGTLGITVFNVSIQGIT